MHVAVSGGRASGQGARLAHSIWISLPRVARVPRCGKSAKVCKLQAAASSNGYLRFWQDLQAGRGSKAAAAIFHHAVDVIQVASTRQPPVSASRWA